MRQGEKGRAGYLEAGADARSPAESAAWGSSCAGARPRRAACRWPPRRSGSPPRPGSAGAPASRSSRRVSSRRPAPSAPITRHARPDEVDVGGRLRRLRIRAHDPQPGVLQQLQRARQVGHRDHRRRLRGARGHLARRRVQRARRDRAARSGQHAAGIRGAQAGAQVVRVLHAVERQHQRVACRRQRPRSSSSSRHGGSGSISATTPWCTTSPTSRLSASASHALDGRPRRARLRLDRRRALVRAPARSRPAARAAAGAQAAPAPRAGRRRARYGLPADQLVSQFQVDHALHRIAPR